MSKVIIELEADIKLGNALKIYPSIFKEVDN